MQEKWKGMQYNGVDYSEWYEVSNLGNIRNTRLKKVREAVNTNKKGYRVGSFTMGTIKNKKSLVFHRIVACTFIPTDDYTLTVNHKDGNKLNNRVDNLEWCTNTENMRHAFKNNLFKSRKGINNNANILSDEDVREIRTLYIPRHPEYNGTKLAEKYGVHPATIQAIVHHRIWKWLD